MRANANFALTMLHCIPLLLVCAGCSGTGPTGAALEDKLTAEARLALDASGTFRFTEPAFPGGRAWNSLATATALADLFPRTFLSVDPVFADEHEAPLSPDGVVRCGRTFFAESALDTLPREWDAATAHRRYSMMRVFQFCKNGRPALLVGVSAHADPLRAEGGRLIFPAFGGGGEFQAHAAPARWMSAMGASPEEAVVLAVQCAGRRIRSVPRLIRSADQSIYAALWRLELESSVQIRTVGPASSVRTVSELYVGQWIYKNRSSRWPPPSVLAAAVPQPDSVLFARVSEPDSMGRGPVVLSAARRLPDLPVNFELVDCRE